MSFELALTVASIFAAVAFVSGSVAAFTLSHRTSGRQRVRRISAMHARSPVKRGPSVAPALTTTLQRFAAFVPKSPKEMSRLQNRLAKAGYHGLGPVIVFTASEIFTPVAFGVAALLLVRGGVAVVFAVLGAMVGYILPGLG